VQNPYNRLGTSTRWSLLQVVTLIDSNGFVKSFATAYVGADSVLRMMGGGIQAVPEYHEE
jgi:hypothetical protein